MTFNFQIRAYKKKDGTHPIRLKITYSSKDIQYLNTGINVLPKQWDKNKQIVKKHPLEEKLNSELTLLKNKVQNIYYKNVGFSARQLIAVYKNNKKIDSESFLDFYSSLIEEMELKGKTTSANNNKYYLSKLKRFSAHVSFNDINISFIKEFELYMLKIGNKTNTIATTFKSINATLNKALKMGLITNNPMQQYTIVSENIEKKPLTFDEIQLLQDAKIDSRHKGKKKARDIFLFSFYCAGMRFKDVCLLKWSNISATEVTYTMSKSKNRSGSKRTIPLSSKAIEILEKYKGKDEHFVFPPLYGCHKKSEKENEYNIYITNSTLNRSLKILARDIGIDTNLSFHVSKHSFTDYAVRNKVDLLMISKLLGHSTLSTTEHYLRDFYKEEEADTIKSLFD